MSLVVGVAAKRSSTVAEQTPDGQLALSECGSGGQVCVIDDVELLERQLKALEQRIERRWIYSNHLQLPRHAIWKLVLFSYSDKLFRF